jgi:hypothetical protein
MIVVVLLLLAVPALAVLVVVLRRNAARAAAGYPAWSTYRVPDPNAVKSGGFDWSDPDRSNGTWGDVLGGGASDGGSVHGAVDGGDFSGDVGGGHGD